MNLKRVVGIKRRQRLSEAALSKLEAGGLLAGLTGAEAEAIRLLVRGDVGGLVEEAARLDEELTEAKRLFRESDPALYEWYLGDAARERRAEMARMREAAVERRRASYRLEEEAERLEERASRGPDGGDDYHGDGPHEGPLEELYENAEFAIPREFENITADEVL